MNRGGGVQLTVETLAPKRKSLGSSSNPRDRASISDRDRQKSLNLVMTARLATGVAGPWKIPL